MFSNSTLTTTKERLASAIGHWSPPWRPTVEKLHRAPDHYVLTETHGAVCVLTLNDPGTRNSLSSALAAELIAKVGAFDEDPALKVLILTGAGPAFCSGFNVGEFSAELQDLEEAGGSPQPRTWEQLDPAYTTAVNGRRTPLNTWDIVLKLMGLQKPVIAAVNGPATGLVLGMALCCDIRVASERAVFKESFVNMGIPPGDGSAWTLQRIVGSGNAMLMQLTGDTIGAREAYRIGLVSRLTSPDELMATALELGQRIAKGSSMAHAMTKLLARKVQNENFTKHLWEAQRAFAIAQAGSDHREGVHAFLEKREPKFS
ncbi:MAG: enoyl-CoA hydratase [Dehalococcoidia bacterium]|nr:enoyl-CoA hydratase [Dehalococcoidia bacterium]